MSDLGNSSTLESAARGPGAVLFPVPMLAFPLLQGRLEAFGQHLLRDPIVLVSTGLPYVVAGALRGWLLAAPRQDVRQGI